MSIAGRLTTWGHGTDGAVSVNTDFTAKTMSLSPSFNAEEADATVFGNGYRSFESTFKNATIDAVYHYDATIFGQLAAIYNNNDQVTWEIGPDGNTTGKVKITGSMVMTKFDIPLTVGDVEKINCTFRVTGAVTFATFS